MYYGTTFWPSYAKKSKNGAWWAPILEKAAAKYFGTYNLMNNGWMSEAIEALTGKPTWKISNVKKTPDYLWNQM